MDPESGRKRTGEDGVEVCAATPCDILYEGAAAAPDRLHRLTLARPGYRVEMRNVKVEDSPLSVKLSALPRPTPPPSAPASAPRSTDAPSVPTGYKTDIPY